MKPYPFVITSTDGNVSLEIIEFRSVDPVVNRDAQSFSFLVRTEPDQMTRLLRVLFSGTVLMLPSETLGVPVYEDRQTTFQVAAIAAVGDYLDEKGIPPTAGPEDSVLTISCFSARIEDWIKRPPASDDLIESYLRSHLYCAWKFGHEGWSVGMLDRIRLSLPIPRIARIVSLYDGDAWEVISTDSESISLKPNSGFLRDERHRREAGADLPMPLPSPPDKSDNPSTPITPYIDEDRISELSRCDQSDYDFKKLITISEELNQCWNSQCYHAVAALNRTLMDHVPPLLGYSTFREVANNYSGSRSFKACMERLERAARKIADQHLHTPIRNREALPSPIQVNFSNEIDVLLAEIIRVKCGD